MQVEPDETVNERRDVRGGDGFIWSSIGKRPPFAGGCASVRATCRSAVGANKGECAICIFEGDFADFCSLGTVK